MEIRRILLPPYDNNCYVLVDPETRHSIIVDAPSNPDKIIDLAAGTELKLVIITHKHRDHWGALEELWRRTGAEIAAHPLDAPDLPVKSQRQIAEGDPVEFGQTTLKVLHTPGHTEGSICLLGWGGGPLPPGGGAHPSFPLPPGGGELERGGPVLISGDTLFPNGPGRTRTPKDLQQIIESITAKLFPLPDDTQVYPGHGEGTVLGIEKQRYTQFATRPRDPDLHGDVAWV